MISISFDQVESPELTRRRLTISDQSGAPLSQIDFDLLGAGPAQRPQNLDGFMGAVIQYAMFVRQPLAIKGRLSRQCLHNIAEFQSLIASYYPQMFRVIDVLPDDVDEGAPAKDAMRAISLFSGGVNSVFTLLRHQGKACPGGLSIKNVALIHHQYLEDPRLLCEKASRTVRTTSRKPWCRDNRPANEPSAGDGKTWAKIRSYAWRSIERFAAAIRALLRNWSVRKHRTSARSGLALWINSGGGYAFFNPADADIS